MILAASFTFLTPDAAALAALAVLPLAALVVGDRRSTRVRRTLGLAAPSRTSRRPRAVAEVVVVALLAFAAMQPALRTRASLRARTDAQAFVVLDTSRSMAAAPSPAGESRLTKAKRIAIGLAAQLGNLPVGLATFTDRVLPNLFPTADRAAFDNVVRATSIEGPPPHDVNTVATTFDALASLGTQGFFPDSVRKRAVVLVTDGESRPFDPSAVAASLAGHGIAFAIVRVGDAGDRIYRPNGTPEVNYRPDPAGAAASVAQLTAAVHEPVGVDPATVVERALGHGPTRVVGVTSRTRTLAPIPALLALVPLLAILGVGGGSGHFAWRKIAPRWIRVRRRGSV